MPSKAKGGRKSKTGKSKGRSAKSGSTKFGRIYGSEIGKGKPNDEAAAIAYAVTKGDESLQPQQLARAGEVLMQESFDSLVKKLEDEGKSAHYAKGIAGKVAKEKGDMPYQKKESEDCPYAKLGKLTERVLSGN